MSSDENYHKESLDENDYSKLDINKLNFFDKSLSLEAALKDVTPIEWSEDVQNGKTKVVLKCLHE